MPHKHKRKRGDDHSSYDLPPTSRAKPLPVIAPTKDFLQPRKRPKLDQANGKGKKVVDDTPKSFARLMAWHKDGKKLPSGRDDGSVEKKSKKNKKAADRGSRPEQNGVGAEVETKSPNSEEQPQAVSKPLTILPGESLAEFNIRVDQNMPLSTASKHHKVKIPGVRDEQPLTKHNKRLARMQSEWRNTEAKLREQREEEDEANEEKREEQQLLWMDVGKPRVKGKKKRNAQKEDNPWKQLEKKRADTKQKNLQDVVQAPPLLDGDRLRKMQKLFKTPN